MHILCLSLCLWVGGEWADLLSLSSVSSPWNLSSVGLKKRGVVECVCAQHLSKHGCRIAQWLWCLLWGMAHAHFLPMLIRKHYSCWQQSSEFEDQMQHGLSKVYLKSWQWRSVNMWLPPCKHFAVEIFLRKGTKGAWALAERAVSLLGGFSLNTSKQFFMQKIINFKHY